MSFEIPIRYSESVSWCSCVSSFPALTSCDVIVWKIKTELFHTLYARYETILSSNELDRSKRFRHINDTRMFLTRSISLRLLLSIYTDTPPDKITFKKGRYAKPSLTDEPPGIHFNLSHSGSLILIAFSASEIGIDVEKLNPKFNFTPLLDEVFTEEEQSYLHEGQQNEKLNKFYVLWTRKEAIAKQSGQGLFEHMNAFSVLNGILSGDRSLLDLKQAVQVNSFAIPSHYMASICFDSQVQTVRYFDFPLYAFIPGT